MHKNSPLAEAIGRACTADGYVDTEIPGLKLFRCNSDLPQQPVLYQPSICVVAQGRKQISFGDHTRCYDPDNYLINSVAMPIKAEILDVTEAKPFLGLSLDIDSYMISQLLIDMETHRFSTSQSDEIILSTAITAEFENCMTRLLACLESEMDLKVLAPTLKREIFYEVLKGPHGDILRNCVANHAGANRIAPVLHYIEENFHTPLDVGSIASYAGMSPSTLHDYFKQVTSMSPMQFVKSLRLHRAHSLLLSGNQASEASYQVGYSSPSQFSREFKRFFGESPRDVQVLVAS